MDKFFRPDYTNVPICPECNSLDVSTDISTNKIVCKKCGYGGEKKVIDFEEKAKDILEKEKEKIAMAAKLGEKISLADKQNNNDPIIPRIPL